MEASRPYHGDVERSCAVDHGVPAPDHGAPWKRQFHFRSSRYPSSPSFPLFPLSPLRPSFLSPFGGVNHRAARLEIYSCGFWALWFSDGVTSLTERRLAAGEKKARALQRARIKKAHSCHGALAPRAPGAAGRGLGVRHRPPRHRGRLPHDSREQPGRVRLAHAFTPAGRRPRGAGPLHGKRAALAAPAWVRGFPVAPQPARLYCPLPGPRMPKLAAVRLSRAGRRDAVAEAR